MSGFPFPVDGPAVHFEHVGLSLGGNSILHDIDFTVEPGTVHCIIGRNGGGKTSLIRCMLGQMPHTGEIRICWRGDRTMGYVPQSLDFDDTLPMTVEDFMVLAGRTRRPAFLGAARGGAGQVRGALERVGMLDRIKRPFGALSGGERQRVLLAQALIPRPALLVLDEPATGLDKSGAAVMHEIVRELAETGTTVVVIHHDLGVVRELADQVTCIDRAMVFSGDPKAELTPERVLNIFSAAARAA